MIKAKPVSDKFWILKDDSGKVGEVNGTCHGYSLKIKGKQQTLFQTLEILKIKTGIVFSTERMYGNNPTAGYVHGYPVPGNNFNAVWDLKSKLPLYTKTQDSKSWFSAGYYTINIKGNWQTVLAPKLIMLQRNDFRGPYKTNPSYDSY